MIPYVTVEPFFLGEWLIQPFAVLVSLGVLTAHFIAVARAGRTGLNRSWAAEMSLAMVLCGFAGAVAFKAFYRPEMMASSGWWGTVRAAPGISSFGGLFGALSAGAVYLAARRAPEPLRYLDLFGFAFPFGFAFGRLGCFLMHDHPGRRSDSGFLTVAYPDGARFDLGLYELLFLIALAAAFALLNRRAARPPGFFFCTLLVCYGGFRVALDRLHVDPPRYAGLSVDTWASGAIMATGLLAWRFLRSRRTL